MINELDRVLAPGGRYITFSLHGIDEVEPYFRKASSTWKVSAFRVKSSRFNESDEGRRRAVAHTMVVCDKACNDGSFKYDHPLLVDGAMSEAEYDAMIVHADNVSLNDISYTQRICTISPFYHIVG